MVEDTWDTRERQWLEQIDDANRRGKGWMPDEFLSDDETVWRAALYDWDALKDDGYLRVQVDQRNVNGKPTIVHGVRLTGKGRRAIGRWPDDASRAVDDLLGRLEDMIAIAPAEQRSSLVRARDTLLGVGRDLLIEFAGAAATRAAGL